MLEGFSWRKASNWGGNRDGKKREGIECLKVFLGEKDHWGGNRDGKKREGIESLKVFLGEKDQKRMQVLSICFS